MMLFLSVSQRPTSGSSIICRNDLSERIREQVSIPQLRSFVEQQPLRSLVEDTSIPSRRTIKERVSDAVRRPIRARVSWVELVDAV